MKFVILTILLAGVALGEHVHVCNETMRLGVDVCGQELFLIGDLNKEKLPETLEEMETHCNGLRSAQRCITNYSNSCLQAMPKQVTSLLVKGATSEIGHMCNTTELRQEFISHSQCFNKDFGNLHFCMENYIDKLQGLHKAKKEDKIPLTCCNYYNFRNCIMERLGKNGNICAQPDLDYMSNMLKGYSIDVLDLLCGHTPPNSDLCNVLISPDKDAGMVRTKSILPPLVHVFSHF